MQSLHASASQLPLAACPSGICEGVTRVLLVEDNPTDALLVEVALEEMAALQPQFHHVELLSEAETALGNGEFDVVLIDLNLPDGQGLGNFERLRELAPGTAMIVLTGVSDEEVALAAIARGASDYLIKGEAPSALLERSIRYAIERKRNENGRLELLKAQVEREEAEAANAAKDQFLATISHELRTPLNAILGWTSLVRGGELDAETTQQALEVIERNARVQAQLIEDLLDVSRIISDNFRLEFSEIDLPAIARGAVETLQPQIRAKNLRLSLEMEPLPALCGDPTRLQQVAWNLLSNAIKFTPDDGHIEVHTCRRENSVVLEVVDSGQGIAPEFLPHIFDRFRQADGSSTRRHGGLGLGLAIVRHIVELHHGTIEAWSSGDGQGARFVVTLPVRSADQVMEDYIR